MVRVASDDGSVAAVRVYLERSGGTRRLCVRLPNDDELCERIESGTLEGIGVSVGDIVRVSIDGTEYHARIDGDTDGRVLRSAFDNRRLARTTDGGPDRLAEWIRSNAREAGDVVLLDVLVAGEAYGLRLPGDRTVYDVRRGPRSSLADIANSLEE